MVISEFALLAQPVMYFAENEHWNYRATGLHVFNKQLLNKEY